MRGSFLSVCLSVCLTLCELVIFCLSYFCLSIYLSVSLLLIVCFSIYLCDCLSFYLFVSLCICPSIRLPICLFVCLSICRFDFTICVWFSIALEFRLLQAILHILISMWLILSYSIQFYSFILNEHTIFIFVIIT